MSYVNNVYVEHSLSAISPVDFTYNFNKEEKLSGKYYSYNNGFSFKTYDAFEGVQDASLSKKTCLILTNNKPLKNVFLSDSRQLNIGTVAGTCFLKSNNQYITTLNHGLYLGGTGEKALISIAVVTDKEVELKLGKDQFIQIDKKYPYTARVSTEALDGNELYRQRFEVDYKDNLICFKAKTLEGYRFLSYGSDLTIRAVGLSLNETVVNPYLFTPEFVSSNGLYYDFDAVTKEIKYYNELSTTKDRYTVKLKNKKIADTHLLLSCSTTTIAASSVANANIASLKTNFTSSGTYSNE
jgi:hypothetical protein